MNRPRIALLPGDGIGPEVLIAACEVLDATGFEAEYVEGDIGWEFWRREGDALPTRTLDLLRSCRCALFGAITSKPGTEAETELSPELQGRELRYESPIVRLRQAFDLFANVRPCRSFPGCPGLVRNDVDLVIFRENTEGLYAGVEWHPLPDQIANAMSDPSVGHPTKMRRFLDAGLQNIAVSTRIMTRPACERIVTAAFEHARTHHRHSVTLLEKANVLRETGGLMTRAFREVAARYPDVEACEAIIDSACMRLVMEPQKFDVIVAENMFGDIVSDLAAGLTGGLGYAPSANLGHDFAVFEPVHGSAPDIAGKGVANPIAAILSAAMMLDWLGETPRAHDIRSSVARVIRDDLPTLSLMDCSTQRVTSCVIDRLGSPIATERESDLIER
ncbi:MAG: isocitrate/isopropylmalate dehydrogenase family protein [Phycisphaerales bacterium]|jgi:3-isopropylmalate dehydrogenase|nr:isocitrate/isopropylmalate dehydrogenase family protein [Phycisphaerales bacterium]